MDKKERLERNLQKWERVDPQGAQKLKSVNCSQINCCNAENGDLNLYKEFGGEKEYFHSQKNPHEEAEKWFQSLDLNAVDTLFVYGVGLGYYYIALKEWLRENPKHSLVFIETDPEVLVSLFENVQGEQLLQDTQVWIFYFNDFKKDAGKFDELCKLFDSHRYKITALAYYLRTHAQMLIHLNTILGFTLNVRSMVDREYLSFGDVFYNNFYSNMFRLPEAYLAKELFGKFKGVPAVICGAGPSLEKNIELLKTLKNRALVIAGGSAVNALNAQGMNPHFGVGLDPNADQVMRVSNNEAYNVPYFYRNRMHANALTLIQGDHLYVNGSVGYPVGNWFEKQLDISGKQIPEGYNVINLSLSLATELGCSPIICVGLDLSYSNDESYAPGILNHPINERRQQIRTKSANEELVGKEDIHGEPVLTLWKWIAEAIWYAKTVAEDQRILLINATEGGIGFPGIPNFTLKEVAEEYLKADFDLETLIHGETQLGRMPACVNMDEIGSLMQVLYEELQSCEEICGILAAEFDQVAASIENGNEPPPMLLTDEAKKRVVALDQISAYDAVLSTFNDYFLRKSTKELQRLEMDREILDESEIQIRKTKLNSTRYESLKKVAKRNRMLLKHFIEDIFPKRKEVVKTEATGNPKQYIDEKAVYEFDGKTLTIDDPGYNLHIKESHPDKEEIYKGEIFYPSGKIKCEQTFVNDLLHGPQTFYNEEGVILSQSWYSEGARQGRTLRYYYDGSLYCIEYYRDGVFDGEQHYFNQNGAIRTFLSYKQGKYDGQVLLYYPNGKKKRELHFVEGVKQGCEKMWNDEGQLKIELEYEKGLAKGLCRLWFDNGTLAKEVLYEPPGQVKSVSYWDKKAKPLTQSQMNQDDFFDRITKQTTGLTVTIQGVIEQVGKVAPLLRGDDLQLMVKEIAHLQTDLNALQEIGNDLLFESGLDQNNRKEAIWKTPQTRLQVEKKLKTMTKQITENIDHIRVALEETVGKYMQNMDEKNSR